MSKALEFIRQCGSFFVVTMNGDFPAARPFVAIIEVGEYLYHYLARIPPLLQAAG